MGELSLRTSDLSNRRLVHGPARWPHAYPPSGSALRGTAGQYHTATPRTLQHLTLALSMTPKLHKLGGSRTRVLHFLFSQHGLLVFFQIYLSILLFLLCSFKGLLDHLTYFSPPPFLTAKANQRPHAYPLPGEC